VSVAVGKVSGIRESIAVLRKVEPKIALAAIATIKAPAQTTANKLKVTAPAIPLSGMAKDTKGGTRTSVKYGGKKRPNHEWNLVSIRLNGPKWTVASDMAARPRNPNYTMVPNLTNKWGTTPSRWAWPVVEKNMGRIQIGVVAACKQVERQASDAMRIYGKGPKF
jgi:hypothetical protein